MGVKTLHGLRRVDMLSKATTNADSPETKACLEQGLASSREFHLRVWQDTREDYWANVRRRIPGGKEYYE
jgi:hypothetical protein